MLENHRWSVGLCGAKSLDRADRIGDGRQVLEAWRDRNPSVPEQLAPRALESQRPQLRCRAVDRHPECECELTLRLRDVPRLDECRVVADPPSDVGEHIRPFEQLCRDGAGRPIIDHDQMESFTGISRFGQQRKVMIDDRRIWLGRAEVHEPGSWHTKHQERGQESMLERRQPTAVVRQQALSHAERRQRHDDVRHGRLGRVERIDRFEVLLEPLEGAGGRRIRRLLHDRHHRAATHLGSASPVSHAAPTSGRWIRV